MKLAWAALVGATAELVMAGSLDGDVEAAGAGGAEAGRGCGDVGDRVDEDRSLRVGRLGGALPGRALALAAARGEAEPALADVEPGLLQRLLQIGGPTLGLRRGVGIVERQHRRELTLGVDLQGHVHAAEALRVEGEIERGA